MENTKKALSSIPLLKTKAGPRDVDLWPQRLKEEYQSLIQVRAVDIHTTHDISSFVKLKYLFLIFQYVQNNKAADNDWFRLESNKEGTKWFGKCWVFQNQLKYEFDIEFDVSFCINNYIYFFFKLFLRHIDFRFL